MFESSFFKGSNQGIKFWEKQFFNAFLSSLASIKAVQALAFLRAGQSVEVLNISFIGTFWASCSLYLSENTAYSLCKVDRLRSWIGLCLWESSDPNEPRHSIYSG